MLMDQKPQKSLKYRGAILLGTESAPLSEDEDEKVKFLLGLFTLTMVCIDHLIANRMAPCICPDPCGTRWVVGFKQFCTVFLHISTLFSALTLLVGRQEGHPACKKLEW